MAWNSEPVCCDLICLSVPNIIPILHTAHFLVCRHSSQIAFSKAAAFIWDVVSKAWEVGEPLTRDSAALAAGSLAAMIGPRHPPVVAECIRRATHQLGATRSSAQRVAAISLSAAGAGLHPADQDVWSSALEALQASLCNTDDGEVGAAAAEAIGGLVGRMEISEAAIEMQSQRQTRQVEALASVLSQFFGLLAEMRPSSLELLQSTLDAAPSFLGPMVSLQKVHHKVKQSPDSIVAGIWHGIGLMAQALSKLGAVAMLSVLYHGSVSLVRSIHVDMDDPDAGEVLVSKMDLGNLLGAIRALPFLFELLLRGEQLAATEDVGAVVLIGVVEKQELLSASSHGCLLLCAAAESLGSVLGALMECGMKIGQESHVAALLTRGLKSSSSTVQCGAAMGCAAMLGAPVAGSSVGYHRQSRGHLLFLAAAEQIPHLQTTLKALEEAALKGKDARSKRVAGLALALLCSAIRKDALSGDSENVLSAAGDVKGSNLNDALMPVASTPALGAMGDLVQFLQTDLKSSSITDMAAAAGALRCLSQSERLPVMNWGAICHSLMRVARPSELNEPKDIAAWKSKVRSSCVSLALVHGYKTSLGLGELVDELLEPHRFRSLEEPLRVELVESLPHLLHALPAYRAAALLASLPSLTYSQAGTWKERLSFETHVWRGMASFIATKGHLPNDAKSLSEEGLMGCLLTLHNRLPPPPTWHAGQWAAVSSHYSHLSDKSLVGQVWKEALQCLIQLSDETLVQLLVVSTENYEQKDANIVFTKAYMAAHGRVPLREMQDCKKFCLDAPDNYSACVSLAVASAFSNSSQAVQEQMLTDVVKSIRFCLRPAAAVRFVACMAAVWSSLDTHCSGEELLSGYSAEMALDALPYCLPKLMSGELWQGCCSSVSEQLLEVMLALAAAFDETFHREVEVIWASLVGMRSSVSQQCFEGLHLYLMSQPHRTGTR
mmetsp:Transcript_12810/g.35975  ORF Transcript_12810/g.35975 Transcript_12810/m.35975 type:complete len:949 (-) Transcript_12810:136-2982(-)